MRPALLIGGVSSGCGKTTVVLGLMAALKQRGLRVQGFKVGPDYIDPGLHTLITERPSWNLDGWMGNRSSVCAAFERAMSGQAWTEPANAPRESADIGVVEGVMGLYDGADGASDCGSSAEIAAWLGIPVILVVDARGMARSIAAIAQGYAAMRNDIHFGGVIATKVGSKNHAELLHAAMHSVCPNIPLLACLPPDERIARASRHLGLHTAETSPLPPAQQALLAEWFSEHAQLAELAALASQASCREAPAQAAQEAAVSTVAPARRARIAVARDQAFCFMYPAMLDALEQAGARLCFFSPLEDTGLPPCDGVWLPGGYPELYAERLAANKNMRNAMRQAAASGIPVHGECGGYMWLLESLEVHKTRYPMLGCLPGTAKLEKRRAALGYRHMRLLAPCALGNTGCELRGHEFHYSALLEDLPSLYEQYPDIAPLWQATNRAGRDLGPEGMRYGSVSGTWIHTHPDSDPGFAQRFVTACSPQ